jgi:hypothetical protein
VGLYTSGGVGVRLGAERTGVHACGFKWQTVFWTMLCTFPNYLDYLSSSEAETSNRRRGETQNCLESHLCHGVVRFVAPLLTSPSRNRCLPLWYLSTWTTGQMTRNLRLKILRPYTSLYLDFSTSCSDECEYHHWANEREHNTNNKSIIPTYLPTLCLVYHSTHRILVSLLQPLEALLFSSISIYSLQLFHPPP